MPDQEMPDSMHSFLMVARAPGILARARRQAEMDPGDFTIACQDLKLAGANDSLRV